MEKTTEGKLFCMFGMENCLFAEVKLVFFLDTEISTPLILEFPWPPDHPTTYSSAPACGHKMASVAKKEAGRLFYRTLAGLLQRERKACKWY